MSKTVTELIKSICAMNSNAKPETLSSFSEDELRDYLRHPKHEMYKGNNNKKVTEIMHFNITKPDVVDNFSQKEFAY